MGLGGAGVDNFGGGTKVGLGGAGADNFGGWANVGFC